MYVRFPSFLARHPLVTKIAYDSQSNPNDPVTWHMVQQQQQQLQYNETGLGDVPSTEVRIRILVGEKGRLGCGVCRGIVPGLTVQVNSLLLIGRSHVL